MGKESLREEIRRQTVEFLSRGGVIEVLPTERVCPKRMQWASDRGMDYSVWDEIGGKDWYRRTGDYQLDPEDFEEI